MRLRLPPRLANAGNYAVYILVRVFVCVLQALSIEACQRVAQSLAWLLNDVVRLRHKITDENLRHAYPDMLSAERQELARRMWEHLILMLAEIAHFPRKVHD